MSNIAYEGVEGSMKSVFKVLLAVLALAMAAVGQDSAAPTPDYKLSPRFREAAVHFRSAMFSYSLKYKKDRLDEQDRDRASRDMDATKQSEGDSLLSLLASEWSLLDTFTNGRNLDRFLKKNKLGRLDFLFTCNKEFGTLLEKKEMTPDDLAKSKCHLWLPEAKEAWFKEFDRRRSFR